MLTPAKVSRKGQFPNGHLADHRFVSPLFAKEKDIERLHQALGIGSGWPGESAFAASSVRNYADPDR